MLLENIPLGKTIEIFVDREGYRYRLVSKVEKASVRRLCVSVIAAGGRVFHFRDGDEIRLVYRDEDQMWEWLKVHAGLAKLDDEPVHYFDIVNKGRSFNRRNAYRVNLDEDVVLKYYIAEENAKKTALVPLVKEKYEALVNENGDETENISSDSEKEGKMFVELRERLVPDINAKQYSASAHVKDVSETGLGVYTNVKMDVDDNFSVEIPSPYGLLRVCADVIRIEEKREHSFSYFYGCVYTESDKKMIKLIYDIQRKKIKKQREQRDFDANYRAGKQ